MRVTPYHPFISHKWCDKNLSLSLSYEKVENIPASLSITLSFYSSFLRALLYNVAFYVTWIHFWSDVSEPINIIIKVNGKATSPISSYWCHFLFQILSFANLFYEILLNPTIFILERISMYIHITAAYFTYAVLYITETLFFLIYIFCESIWLLSLCLKF